MKHFPSVDVEIRKKTPVWVFGKLDGSSIAAERNNKQGWYKFGTRKRLLGADDRQGKAIELFKNKYADDLDKVFKKERWDRGLVYFEFHGPKSCFGQHEATDNFDVTLFDVSIHKKGILHPRDFVNAFGHLDIAPLLYRGNVTEELIQQIKTGTLPGMPEEGVVCKGDFKSPGLPLMFKIKSDIWIQKLRDYCAGNNSLFNELL